MEYFIIFRSEAGSAQRIAHNGAKSRTLSVLLSALSAMRHVLCSLHLAPLVVYLLSFLFFTLNHDVFLCYLQQICM